MTSLGWLDRRLPPRRCSLSEILLKLGSGPHRPTEWAGRSSDCEIHLDGNMFFWVAAVAGAGLAFLLNQAITMAGRRRRRRAAPPESAPVGDLLWLGRDCFISQAGTLLAPCDTRHETIWKVSERSHISCKLPSPWQWQQSGGREF